MRFISSFTIAPKMRAGVEAFSDASADQQLDKLKWSLHRRRKASLISAGVRLSGWKPVAVSFFMGRDPKK
jgi:hypothetical protein